MERCMQEIIHMPRKTTETSGDEAKAMPLVPDGLAPILAQKPVAFFEREEDYDGLHVALRAEFGPRDLIEHLLVKDLADTYWELNRLAGSRKGVFVAEISHAMQELIKLEHAGSGLQPGLNPTEQRALMIAARHLADRKSLGARSVNCWQTMAWMSRWSSLWR